jgi:uncharacterized membrane protein YfcA
LPNHGGRDDEVRLAKYFGGLRTNGYRDDALTARRKPAAFAGGAIIGALQGLAGLGGAELRLPLLIGVFNFAALEAVILNKAMSLVVVASALPFRASTVPFGDVALHWPIIANLLAGSLADACFGAGLATRIRSDNPLQGGESLVRALIPLCEWGSRNRAQVTELLQQSSTTKLD